MNDHDDDARPAPRDGEGVPGADAPGDDELILYCYGEAPDPQAVAARIASSADTARRHAELVRLLATIDGVEAEAPAAGFEERLWRRLQPLQRLPVQRQRWPARLLPFAARNPRWLPAAAAAVLLLAVGFLAGRLATGTRAPAPARMLTAEARERILVETLAQHLERSQRLFTELANAPAEEAVAGVNEGLLAERRAAGELLVANRLYRTAAERGERPGIAALLARMEPVLLDLANLPPDPAADDVAFLRQRIEEQGLLFKTRVASELLTRTLRHAPNPTPQPRV
jgi:hypothetical protein